MSELVWEILDNDQKKVDSEDLEVTIAKRLKENNFITICLKKGVIVSATARDSLCSAPCKTLEVSLTIHGKEIERIKEYGKSCQYPLALSIIELCRKYEKKYC